MEAAGAEGMLSETSTEETLLRRPSISSSIILLYDCSLITQLLAQLYVSMMIDELRMRENGSGYIYTHMESPILFDCFSAGKHGCDARADPKKNKSAERMDMKL